MKFNDIHSHDVSELGQSRGVWLEHCAYVSLHIKYFHLISIKLFIHVNILSRSTDMCMYVTTLSIEVIFKVVNL